MLFKKITFWTSLTELIHPRITVIPRAEPQTVRNSPQKEHHFTVEIYLSSDLCNDWTWSESYSTFKSSLLLWAQAAWNRPWVFSDSHLFMILTSSVKAMQPHRIKLPLGALMLFWPPKRRSSFPSVYQCFQMGKGAMSRTQPWVGASPSWRGSFWPACTSPPTDAVSPFSTAGLQPTIPRELQREPPPSSLLYAAQKTQSLCGLSLRGGSLFVWPPGVLQNGLSEESLDHKGQPFPSRLLN